MSREHTLFKNTIIYAIGNFSSRFLGFLILPLYTSYLSTKDYGYYDLILTTVSLLLPIVSFQVYDGLYRNLLDSCKDVDRKMLISSSLSIIVKNLVILNIVFLIIDMSVNIKHSILISLYLNVFVIYNVYIQVARGFKENYIYSIAGVINTLIIVASSLLLMMKYHLKVEALLISMIASYLISTLYIEYKLKVIRYINIKFIDKEIKHTLIKYSIPLIPNTVNWWIMNVSDRYLLSHFIGMEANGIYAVANKFPSILMAINSIFYLAWQDSAITEYNAKDRNEFYTKMFNGLMVFQFTFVMVLLAFSKELIDLLIDEKFSNVWIYVPFLYMAAIFNAFSSFYGTGFLSAKKTKQAFYSSVFGSIVNFIMNLIFIPQMGIQGAAISMMIAFLVMWLIRIKQTKEFFDVKLDKIQFLVLTLLMGVCMYLYYENTIYTNIILISVSVLMFLIFNKKLIVTIFNKQKIVKYKKKTV